MKTTALLTAGCLLLFACKKEENKSTISGINGEWKMHQNTRINFYPDRKDTSRYDYQSTDQWNFGTDNKITRSINATKDTVHFTLLENPSRLVTSPDPAFIFRVDTFEIKTLDRSRLELVLRANSYGTEVQRFEATISFIRR